MRKPGTAAKPPHARNLEVGGGRAPKARDGGNGLYGVPGEAGESFADAVGGAVAVAVRTGPCIMRKAFYITYWWEVETI